MRVRRAMLLVLALGLMAACGDGEDRPGAVTSEGGSGSGTHAGSGSGSGTHAGHGHTPAPPAFPATEASQVVEVSMEDVTRDVFRYVGIPAVVKGPKVFFKASNRGAVDHELLIFDANQRAVSELHAVKPGQTGELAAQLSPGTYTARCHVKSGDRTHDQQGMQTTFTVQ